jgi:hypothetical protein
MEPERQARSAIDDQLTASGWLLQDMANLHISTAPGALDAGPQTAPNRRLYCA